MAPNENGDSKWLMRTIIGSFGVVICLLIGLGYNNLISSNERQERSFARLTEELKKHCYEGETRDAFLEKRIHSLEILITMPYDQRIRTLQKLQQGKQ